jgi:hypothetical protein
MRRVVIWLSGLAVVAASFLAAGSPAFAMRVAPAGGASASLSPVVHHSAGLSVWQVAAIVIGSLVVVGAAIVGGALIRASRRPIPNQAAS